MSEDVNIEHLPDVFMTVGANSNDVWGRCGYFMAHLHSHKRQLVVLGPKIEGLPDHHPLKPWCLVKFSHLVDSVGNHAERKRLLTHALKLWKERGDDLRVARTLRHLSDANRMLSLYEEGVQQVKEALEIFRQHKDISMQAKYLCNLAWLCCDWKQFDAAEEAAFRAIDLLDAGDQSRLCQCHRLLGNVYRTRASQRRLSNISRLPSGLRYPSTGRLSCFGFIIAWRSCFPRKAGSTTHTPELNAPSRM